MTVSYTHLDVYKRQALWDSRGFQVTDHEVKLYGYCRECLQEMEEENGK